MKFLDALKKVLSADKRFLGENQQVIKTKVSEAARSNDTKLLKALLKNDLLKESFFTKVDDIYVFDKNKFVWVLESKEFLPDSYTVYRNKVGLVGADYNLISPKHDISLVWPYKDCVLEGGQTKDDQKRNEIFYNEILAPDQVNRLLDPKVLSNAKRYTKDGVEENIEFKDDDNLIIKGNNLLALSSLLERYEGRVKCIYIDPPYNTNNDTNNTFKYNNNFNHSTWLTFMKNRLKIAKRLLIPGEGAIIIAIDKNEQAYLGVMLDELFSNYEKHMITVVHNPRGVQGNNFSYTNEFLYFVIPKGKKIIQDRKLDKDEISFSPLRNWGGESLRTDAKNCFYPILVKNDKIIGFGDVVENDVHPKANEVVNDVTYIYPIDMGGVERKWRYARNSIEGVKHLLRVFNRKDGIIDIEIGKDFGQYKTVWMDKKYDANAYGKQWVNRLITNQSFSFPKSIYAVKEAIFSIVANDKKAIILDFFGGSGTSAEAVSMINRFDDGDRKFIIIEQMDYITDITRDRIVNSTVFDNERTTIIYCELLEDSESLVTELEAATTSDAVKMVLNKAIDGGKVIPSVLPGDLRDSMDDFDSLSMDEQKNLVMELLNKNKLYVNLSDIDDEDYGVSEADKKFTRSFYGEE